MIRRTAENCGQNTNMNDLPKSMTIKRTVETSGLACTMKSGSLKVLATPQMIAWMEEAACLCLDLPEDQTSVGVLMSVTHDAASPLGAEIMIKAELTEQEKRVLSFEVSAWMNDVCIGKGLHKRVIVNTEKFLSRIYPES